MTIKNDLQTIKNYIDNVQKLKNQYIDDKIKIKTDFNFLLDNLCKDGIISDLTYNNAYLTMNSKNNLMIYCKSYKLKLV